MRNRSRHSRLIDPMNRSQWAFMFGERGGIFMVLRPPDRIVFLPLSQSSYWAIAQAGKKF